MISENLLNKILDKKLTPQELSIDELSSFCKFANEKYRAGTPIITDADYDFLFLKELRNKDPDNKFLKSLEPEVYAFSEEKFLLPQNMLSIDKAYSYKEIIKADDFEINLPFNKAKTTLKITEMKAYIIPSKK